MNAAVQLTLFSDPKQQNVQRALLDDLIALKQSQIEDELYHNFWGTAEKIQQRQAEVAEKVQKFVSRVQKAFPDVMLGRDESR